MTKYTKLFKFKVVQDYLTSALGIELIARKYLIKSHTTVSKCARRYQRFCIKGFEVRKMGRVYAASACQPDQYFLSEFLPLLDN